MSSSAPVSSASGSASFDQGRHLLEEKKARGVKGDSEVWPAKGATGMGRQDWR